MMAGLIFSPFAFAANWTIKGGYSYDSGDYGGDEDIEVSVMSIDIGYSHLFLDEVKINNEFESSVPTLAATLTGEYEASINIFSAQVNWRY